MTARYWHVSLLCSWVALGACAADAAAPGGPGVTIRVAPLDLPATLGVEYAVAVFNAPPTPATGLFAVDGTVQATHTGTLVWQRGSLTSIRFGGGPNGGISFVGPCDASSATNYVALVLRNIAVASPGSYLGASGEPFDGLDLLDDQNSAFTSSPGSDDGDPDFANPCPYNGACVLPVSCVENQDTAVVFDLTIARDADQGFFDFAVNFGDIFCSAKFETCQGVTIAQEPLTLELDGVTYYAYLGPADLDGVSERFWARWWDIGSPYWTIYRQAPGGGLGAHYTDDYNTAGAPPQQTLKLNNAPYFSLGTGATVTGTPITLLHGPSPGAPRQHTGIAALACTANPSTTIAALATELLLTTPTVTCDAGAVVFPLPIAGQPPGNNSVAVGGHTLYYALYAGQEVLPCGSSQFPCNKVYFNIAINIESLADQGLTGCALQYLATARQAGDESTFDAAGQLADPATQYGAISFAAGPSLGGLPLTTAAGAASCNSHPLGATESLVQAVYIKGSAYGEAPFAGFDVSTLGGAAVALTAAEPTLRVFVTSQRWTGALGGLAGADAKCQAAAGSLSPAPTAGQTWKAWISVSTSSPATRFGATVGTETPFALPDGTIVANDWSDLISGSLRSPINMTELGEIVTGTTPAPSDGAGSAWSNTKPNGTSVGDWNTCASFTSSNSSTSGEQYGQTGNLTDWASPGLGAWTQSSWTPPCSWLLRLYCFEQVP